MPPTSAVTDPDALVQRVLHAGPRFPAELRTEVLAAGAAVVPALLVLLEDEELARPAAPGHGYGPIHAAELLTELHASAAIEPLLRVLRAGETTSILHERVVRGLPVFGAEALEPICRALREERDQDILHSLCGVAASLGVKDERILTALLEELRADAGWAASHLEDYGDPEAIPHLERAGLALDVSDPDAAIAAGMALKEIQSALAALGGSPSAALREKIEKVDEIRREQMAAVLARAARRRAVSSGAPRVERAKVGRNDPCPCGSGKKYKKCCLNAGSAPGA